MSMANRLAAEFIGTAWLAPIVGAVLAGLTYRWLGQEVTDKVVVADTPRRRYGRPERPGHRCRWCSYHQHSMALFDSRVIPEC